jgi:hypothetical protein
MSSRLSDSQSLIAIAFIHLPRDVIPMPNIAFIEIFSLILSKKPLPKREEQWGRNPFTRKELNDLCVITANVSEEEIKRRVKATTYPHGAFIESTGRTFSPDTFYEKEGETSHAKDSTHRRGGACKGFNRFNQNRQPIRNHRYIRLAT